MKKKLKVIVAHPAQQHSYRLATALKNEDMLFKYITTIYDKKNSIFMRILKFFLNKSNLMRANSRKCIQLKDSDVLQFCDIRGLIELLLLRVDKSKQIYRWWSRHTTDLFGKKVARYAIKNKVDAVIMYDTKALKCFEILRKKAPRIRRIIDMSAPNFKYMDLIFRGDLELNNHYSLELEKEMKTKEYMLKLNWSIKELELTDFFLVASSFSKISLLHSQVQEEKIFICPYGVDYNLYNSDVNRDYKSKLRCIFIGGVTQKKGAFYLLEAVKKLDQEKFSVHFIGEYDKSSNYYEEFQDICNFEGYVTKDRVAELCGQSDILVFPSLADGFGLSVLEALASGIPVICSENAGASDLIQDEYNGFVIKAANAEEIYDKLLWFNNNREKISIMSENARKTAKQYSWDRYNRQVEKAINTICDNA
jgi:glycosyltransferase involved in cell wall biosynthesis